MVFDATGLLLLAETSNGNIFVYFGQSNFAGKVIIVTLIVFSLLAWTIMIGKYNELRRSQLLNFSFEENLKAQDSVTAPNQSLRINRGIPYSYLFHEALQAYHRIHQNGKESSISLRMNHVENALHRALARKSSDYEQKMVFLATIVTGAPFLGLLGTVWGVMDAFGAVALRSSVTLQMLAPGVSGALLTTVAGLLVAIPSVFGYNILLTRTRSMITELENYASSLADRFELENE